MMLTLENDVVDGYVSSKRYLLWSSDPSGCLFINIVKLFRNKVQEHQMVSLLSSVLAVISS